MKVGAKAAPTADTVNSSAASISAFTAPARRQRPGGEGADHAADHYVGDRPTGFGRAETEIGFQCFDRAGDHGGIVAEQNAARGGDAANSQYVAGIVLTLI